MTKLITLIDAGAAQGCIAGLIALGIVLLYKTTGVINFAQGSLLTLGAYFGLWLNVEQGMPTVPAYLLAVAGVFLVGVVIERVGYAPLRRHPLLTILISTFAINSALEAIIIIWQGSSPKTLPSPFGNTVWHLSGAAIPKQNVLIFAATIVLVAGIVVFLQRTSPGRQVRALATDRETASLQGIRVVRLSVLMFGLSAALAGFAGLLVVPTVSLSPTIGFDLLLSSFAAVVLGGFDRVGSTVLIAVGVGVVTQLLTGYVAPSLTQAWPYMILLAALAVRPQGLLKEVPGVRY